MYIVKDSHNYVFMEKRQRCLLFYLESTARRSSISIISQETEKIFIESKIYHFHCSRLRTSTCSTFAKFAENLNLRESFDARLNKSEIWVCSNVSRLAWGGGVWFQRLNINDRVNFRHTQIFLRPPQVVEKRRWLKWAQFDPKKELLLWERVIS